MSAAPLAPLTGRTALVTGAASGIGAAIAVAYARAEVVAVHADVPDEREVARMFTEMFGDGTPGGGPLRRAARGAIGARSITAVSRAH